MTARSGKALTLLGGAGVGAAALLRRQRRRQRLASAVEGIGSTVSSLAGPVGPAGRPPGAAADEAHAPRHQHLAAPARGDGDPAGPEDRHTGVDHHPGHVRKG